ncbi:prolipoprotein diacylglyceryl transferase, partial [Peribacillus sp. SIMBA_075]
GRFFVEGLRTDSLMLGPLRIAQVMSIGIVVISIIFIIVRRKMGQADKRYSEN